MRGPSGILELTENFYWVLGASGISRACRWIQAEGRKSRTNHSHPQMSRTRINPELDLLGFVVYFWDAQAACQAPQVNGGVRYYGDVGLIDGAVSTSLPTGEDLSSDP